MTTIIAEKQFSPITLSKGDTLTLTYSHTYEDGEKKTIASIRHLCKDEVERYDMMVVFEKKKFAGMKNTTGMVIGEKA
jgi:cobalamin biosynthesis Co2+ chelatase CbiK